MMISSRGRYCLRVMTDLAEHQGEGYIFMKDVAARQDISLKYLEKILPILVKNGIVEGLQGKTGGCRLKRKPEEYKLSEHNMHQQRTQRNHSLCPLSFSRGHMKNYSEIG